MSEFLVRFASTRMLVFDKPRAQLPYTTTCKCVLVRRVPDKRSVPPDEQETSVVLYRENGRPPAVPFPALFLPTRFPPTRSFAKVVRLACHAHDSFIRRQTTAGGIRVGVAPLPVGGSAQYGIRHLRSKLCSPARSVLVFLCPIPTWKIFSHSVDSLLFSSIFASLVQE